MGNNSNNNNNKHFQFNGFNINDLDGREMYAHVDSYTY